VVKVALDGISLRVNRGEMAGVFGASGSGKTTLLRIAAGLEAPDSGDVSYGGHSLRDMPSRERTRLRRQEVACVWAAQSWQDGLSVEEHVTLPLLVDHRERRAAARRAREALLVCEAEQCASMGLDELSDGERQRVAIARALVTEPRLLLADGPASHLPIHEREQVMLLLSSLARDARVAVLVTGADTQAVVHADPILYLRDGQLVTPAVPSSELGVVYPFPPARPRRTAADA